MKKLFVIFAAVFLCSINVSAASICDYKEQTALNQKAANIKVNYEVVTEREEYGEIADSSEVFDISIFNVTEDFYIVVKNNINNVEKKYTVDDVQNGIIKFRWTYATSVTNFTIQVYSTNKTSCPDEKYKTIYLTTPRYNKFYRRETCQNNLEFYLCQKFVTFSEISEDKFLNQLEKYRNNKINTEGHEIVEPEKVTLFDKIFEFLDNYKWYIISSGVVILGVIVVIQRKKMKKQRELGL